MAVLAQSKVQRAPHSASDRANSRCLDKSTKRRQAPCDTFPVYFPSFQQLASQGLPELPGLSLNLMSPRGFVSHELVPVVPRARADLQHPPCPSAGSCRGRSIVTLGASAAALGTLEETEKGARPGTAEAKSLKLKSLSKKLV